MARLVYSAGKPGERIFELGEITLIGRHPGCQVQLLDNLVSKEHALIERRGGEHWIRDLGAMNGTGVNGVRLVSERRLEHLDEVQVVQNRLLFLDPESVLRRSPTGNPYRKAAQVVPDQLDAKQVEPKPRAEQGDLASLRRFYALVRMLSAEASAKQLALDATHGLLSLCDADWAVLCSRADDATFQELARAGRDKPPEISRPAPGIFEVALNARAPTFQLGQDRVLQLVVPLVRADRARGVFWIGLESSVAISPMVELLGTYGAFVATALDALGAPAP